MKRLFRMVPLDIAKWLFPDALFNGILPNELEDEDDDEVLYTDVLYDLTMHGKRVLLHVEFQKRGESRLAERMWKYNVRATLQYDCPVWSCVMYLVEDSPIAQSVLVQFRPDGRSIHHFEFEVICLWKIPTQELKEKGLIGLLPLLPLTREGKRHEVVEEIITLLMSSEEESQRNLLPITYALSSLAFEHEEENLNWLYRRFAMIDDIIRETPAYKVLTKEAREEGIQEGIEQERQRGLQLQRELLLNVVKVHFPKLARLARKQGSVIDEVEVLNDLIVKVSSAPTMEEARRHLLAVDEGEEDM
jgi:predicted transposase YdaD